LEPYIKPSNALTKVSVSPKGYFYYTDDRNYHILRSPYDITTSINALEFMFSVTVGIPMLVQVDRLRPLTVAEKILFVNE
jgi:elongation factor P hydroxylase